HEVFILNIVTGLVTLAGVYCAVLHASGRVPALWAAAFWAVIGGTYTLWANQPKVEAFLNSFLVWSVALLFRLKSDSFHWKLSLGAGAVIVLASFYKHSTVLIAFWLALGHLAAAWSDPARRRIAFRQVELFMGMGLLAWVALFSYYAARGYWRDFFDALITYNQYFTGGPMEGIKRLSPQYWFPFFLRWAMPVAIPIIIVCVIGVKRGPTREWLVFTGYLLGVQTSISFHSYVLQNYSQLWLPVMAIGCGMAMGQIPAARLQKLLVHGAGSIVLVYLLCHELPWYGLTPQEIVDRKYNMPWSTTTQVRDLSKEIKVMLEPGETMYEWGFNACFFFYTGISPPVGNFLNIHVRFGPLREDLTQRVLDDLQRNKPELVLFPRWFLDVNPVTSYCHLQYAPLPENAIQGHFILLARKGGALEARLKQRGREE
ncbi:MAG: hypothetical protein QF886_03300, partial [Planctomycetota bacterium]|nr:hypothetical protein [Planctomycetota bacterium]